MPNTTASAAADRPTIKRKMYQSARWPKLQYIKLKDINGIHKDLTQLHALTENIAFLRNPGHCLPSEDLCHHLLRNPLKVAKIDGTLRVVHGVRLFAIARATLSEESVVPVHVVPVDDQSIATSFRQEVASYLIYSLRLEGVPLLAALVHSFSELLGGLLFLHKVNRSVVADTLKHSRQFLFYGRPKQTIQVEPSAGKGENVRARLDKEDAHE